MKSDVKMSLSLPDKNEQVCESGVAKQSSGMSLSVCVTDWAAAALGLALHRLGFRGLHPYVESSHGWSFLLADRLQVPSGNT